MLSAPSYHRIHSVYCVLLTVTVWFASALEEPVAKEKYMRRLMTQLPEPNYSTAMFILDHLIKYVNDHLQCGIPFVILTQLL